MRGWGKLRPRFGWELGPWWVLYTPHLPPADEDTTRFVCFKTYGRGSHLEVWLGGERRAFLIGWMSPKTGA